MEDMTTEDPARVQARERFRVRMLKMSKYIAQQADPSTAVDLSNVPPHLAYKYQ